MDRFRRSARIDAPLDDVFAFHSEARGLLAVTPGWMDMRVERARGPDGEADPDVLATGAEVELSIRPVGFGPRQRWVSRIVDKGQGEGRATFRDVMVEGPFPHWVHTHRFEAANGATVMTDLVEYELPFVPGPLSSLGRPFLEVLFAYRHRRTRQLLERQSR